jgi:hypothetical protein
MDWGSIRHGQSNLYNSRSSSFNDVSSGKFPAYLATIGRAALECPPLGRPGLGDLIKMDVFTANHLNNVFPLLQMA